MTTDIIISWENGINRPTRERFESICRVLGVNAAPWVADLRHSYGADSFSEYREKRSALATELREARRKAGITPAQLRLHGVTPQRLTKIECSLSWPTEAEMAAMRECYRRHDLAPGYKRALPKMHSKANSKIGHRRLPLTPDERRAAVRGGEYIRRHRLAAHLTIKGAARVIGVGHNTYEQWESGRNRPTADNLVRIAMALGFTVDDYHRAAGTPAKSAADYAAEGVSVDGVPKVTFPVRRGSTWARNGRCVVVEVDADFGDRIRYRPFPDGEMMVTSWQTFMGRYAEVGA